MQPQNIDLLSQINTSEEGLLSKEPMFDEKNSLMYKGVVSNMTVDKGDGILSTTGKNIKIEGNTLTAGNQVFSINNDFTVEPFDSGICGEDDIAIEETIVSSSKEIIEFSRAGEVIKSIKLTGVDKVWKSTVWNFSYFAFVYKKDNTFEFEMRNTAGDVVTSGNSITFTENDHFTPGNTLTAIVLNNLYAFGFDDLDYRKRFTVTFKAGVKKVYRGFGNISSNGMVFGEPVPCVLSRQGGYYGCGSVYIGDVKEENPLFSVQGGPNIYDIERYRILDNGVENIDEIVTDINPETGLKITEIDDLGVRGRSNVGVLVAEDSVLLNKLICDSLKKAGYNNIIHTENGQEAYDIVTECKNNGTLDEHVQIIITDIEMPIMDGHRLTKLVKSDDATKDIPIIIFSSLVNDEMKRKGESLGADAQLSKPEIGKLVLTVDKLVQGK